MKEVFYPNNGYVAMYVEDDFGFDKIILGKIETFSSNILVHEYFCLDPFLDILEKQQKFQTVIRLNPDVRFFELSDDEFGVYIMLENI